MKDPKVIQKYPTFEWTDVTNPSKEELTQLAQAYDLNPMLVQDSLQHGHLPKIEQLTDYRFLILRAYTAHEQDKVSTVGQLSNKISFFIKSDCLITVHRKKFEFLANKEKDYQHLDELLLDIIADMIHSFDRPVKAQSDKIDEIEKTLFLKNGYAISMEEMYFQKSKARISKKLLNITQNVINQLAVHEVKQSKLQDIKDLMTSLILHYDEVVEDTNNLMHTYMSITAQKSNDVMKLLTIFSAFFLPLTFIVGIYGMNFDHIPELHWEYGYYLSLAAMALIALVVWIWFKRKRIL
ncbi:MAG TPA: CorA family divalent cation transporter [Saprospiraceae bacterium]|nr:CorA family divalent cation transporter [Saprospiraceae bacterium]HMQ82097.1 CorA family divalent cation transporter [Saprospiraceae bacterium]